MAAAIAARTEPTSSAPQPSVTLIQHYPRTVDEAELGAQVADAGKRLQGSCRFG